MKFFDSSRGLEEGQIVLIALRKILLLGENIKIAKNLRTSGLLLSTNKAVKVDSRKDIGRALAKSECSTDWHAHSSDITAKIS
tara:strand:- start:143 stop:391 length:249 start_codon:yes stop_codon:yes gene_type:complete